MASEISDLVSVDFAKSNFFRKIWQISLIAISLVAIRFAYLVAFMMT